MITVILNVYKRSEYLKQQIESINNQTIKPLEILIWNNKPEDIPQENLLGLNYKVVQSNHNFKFHGRFALGLLAQTEYVAFFDDDTIPGNRWFQNCIDTIKNGYDGILGSAGILLQGNRYNPHQKVGWNGLRSENTIEVDLVGHAWFMKKDYLRYLWYEEPISWDNGEDIQLSYQAQKYGNVKTFVPPHPSNDQSLWGSMSETGSKYGDDSKASFKKGNHYYLRNDIVLKSIQNGWKIVKQNE